MRKKWNNIIYLNFLIGCLLVGCIKAETNSHITINNAENEKLLEINAWGEVKYNKEYQINIEFPATVEFIEIKEGDVVNKGDVLAVLDITEFNFLIEKLESIKAAGESMLSGTYQDTSGLEAQIVQAQKDIAIAQRETDNYRILYSSGAVSQAVLNQYISTLNNQKTNLQVLQVQLEQMTKSNISNVDYQTNELNSITKDLETYQNKKTKDYLKDNHLICNLDRAIVKNIYVKNGSLLGETNNTVMDLIDMDSIYVSAEVEEEFIQYISMDSRIRVVPAMNPEIELEGLIKQISAMAVEKDGNRVIKVQIEVSDPEELLKPGYTVDVYFYSDTDG